ncbi:cyclin-D4-1-like isoform X1 [Carex littledalei]|uniref:Cyclin-D4-1-like isoform X1 n=1 Tax=Carex littledalei TaxID=544730 RepID=A0A833RDR3_9POAL|nr:cyclin-D4-1-like isoform X1 [Carex littledalei]
MAPSYECSASILLCAEDNNSILDFDEEEEETEVTSFQDLGENRIKSRGFSGKRSAFHGDFLDNFPLQSEECMALLVKKETEHLPLEGYYERLLVGSLELSIRATAIDWIWKVHRHYNFGPLSAALAVNFLDRFLSVYELPEGKAWMTQLLSVACLSLAAKMEETYVPLSLDLQVCDAKYVFEAKTIQRMELLVLSTLKWRMQAVTPFSFFDYFLHKFNNGIRPPKYSLYQGVELILNIVKGTDFLAFRPSEIAAAVALAVIGETQVVDMESALSCCNHVSKGSVMRCYEAIESKFITRNLALKMHYNNNSNDSSSRASVASAPHSPIGVLDAACLSYKSCESHVGHDTSPCSKRRKIWR